MNNFRYTNEKCPVCGEQFNEESEIVVCPLCGTPHHKSCYSKNGECANSEKHSDGFVWEPQAVNEVAQEHQANENPNAYANPNPYQNPNVNAEVPPYSAPVPPYFAQQAQNPLNAFPPEIENGIPTQDAAVVIKKNALTYLRKFFQIKSGKRTFNFCAFLFSGYWFIYRKMYKLGAIILAITLALSIIPTFIPQYNKLTDEITTIEEEYTNSTADDPMASLNEMYGKMGEAIKKYPVGVAAVAVIYATDIAISIYCGLIADKKYKQHIEEKVREINSSADSVNNEEFRRLRLFNEGGTTFGYAVLTALAVNIISDMLLMFIDMLNIL